MSSKITCNGCGSRICERDDLQTCAICELPFHHSCLGDEGEDGLLCTKCGKLCTSCNMVINIDQALSNHIQSDGCCPFE